MEDNTEHLGFLFLAVGDEHRKATGATPRAAAVAYVDKYPTKRKPFDVHLAQNVKDASGTAYRYYLGGPAWRKQTRTTAADLPEHDANKTDLPAFLAAVSKAAFVFLTYYKP